MVGKLSHMTSVVQTGVTILKKVLNAGVNGAQPQQDSEVTDDVFDEILDADITAEEVKAAIRHLKNGKAAGPDGIIGEILKAAEKSSFISCHVF